METIKRYFDAAILVTYGKHDVLPTYRLGLDKAQGLPEEGTHLLRREPYRAADE